MRFIRFVIVTMSLICVMVFSSSCSISSNKVETTSPANEDPHDNEIISNPALSRSGALVVATNQIDGTFNPFYSENTAEKWIEDLVFDGLFVFDSNSELENALAESLSISEDGLTYTITLKDGLKFQDGTDVLASDIVFTYETLLNPLYSGRYRYSVVRLDQITEIDSKTVALKFTSKAMENLQALVVPILSKNYYQFAMWSVFEDGYKPPMGTGPFIFDTYANDESIVLIKNASYWNQNPSITGIIIKEMDETRSIQAFKDGSIDLIELPKSKRVINEIKELGYGNILTQKTNIITYISLNLNLPIFSEPNVRKAMLYALDRDQFINEEWQGFAETIHFLATGIEEYNTDDVDLENYKMDIEKAKELLDIIGFRDDDGDGIREKSGEKLAFTWTVFTDVDWSYNFAEYAASQWKALGMDVTLSYVDYSEMLRTLQSGQTFDVWNLAWEMDYSVNPSVLFGSLTGQENMNYSSYSNERADQIFDALNLTESFYEKELLLKEWHTLQNEEVPYIPIGRLKDIWAYNSRVKNFSLNDYALWTSDVTAIEIDILQ